jgi:hypothetical protein
MGRRKRLDRIDQVYAQLVRRSWGCRWYRCSRPVRPSTSRSMNWTERSQGLPVRIGKHDPS